MKRAKLWSALLLAVATGSGCGTLPTSEAAGKAGMRGRMAAGPTQSGPAAPASGHADSGFNYAQVNVLDELNSGTDTLGAASVPTGGSISVEQSNQIATLLLDDPMELLDHYKEVPGNVVWDLTTHSFYFTQVNLAANVVSYSSTYFKQLNKLLVIVDPDTRHFSGTFIQLNAIDGFTVLPGSDVAIAQINDIAVIHRDEDGPDADEWFPTWLSSAGAPVSSGYVLKQHHEQIIYIDVLGRPHLYAWQAPMGKNGLGYRRAR